MPGAYEEVFQPDGTARPAYVALRRRLGRDPLRPTIATWRKLRDRPLGDDARVLPIPWVLTGAEYASVLRPGIAQRARALQAFFADLVLDGGCSLDGATSLTRQRLDLILRSEGLSLARLRTQWRGHTPDEIRFVYAPDLVRGPDGRWCLLEDNVGCVGGSADAHAVWAAYLAAAGTRHLLGSSPPAEPDLLIALRRWLGALAPAHGDGGDSDGDVGDGEVVALLGCEADRDPVHSVLIDENSRRRSIVQRAGVAVVDADRLQQLLRDPAAIRLRGIVNFRVLPEPIEEAFRRGITLLNAPGTEILGNKALLPHVGEMIRFFLGEEPVITTPPTSLCDGGVLPRGGDWVVKSVSGCQGTEVFTLGQQPPRRRDAVRLLVRTAWPDRPFVAQQRVEPSRISGNGPGAWDAHPVELRPVCYVVGWSQVHVSGRPLGKAVWGLDPCGRHNLTQGACYVPVIVLDTS